MHPNPLVLQVKEMLLPFGQLKAFNLVMDRGTGNSKVGVGWGGGWGVWLGMVATGWQLQSGCGVVCWGWCGVGHGISGDRLWIRSEVCSSMPSSLPPRLRPPCRTPAQGYAAFAESTWTQHSHIPHPNPLPSHLITICLTDPLWLAAIHPSSHRATPLPSTWTCT